MTLFLVFFLCAPIILHEMQFDIHACSLLCIQICFLKWVNCVHVCAGDVYTGISDGRICRIVNDEKLEEVTMFRKGHICSE